jgi:arylsulfatase A-like enzyme
MDWALKVDSIEQVGEGYSADFNLVDFSKPVQNGPNVLGFDYSYALPASLDMAPYVYVENDQVTQIPSRETIDEGEYSWWRKGPTSPDFIHEDVTPNFFERTIQYIQSQSSQEKPFFLYLALPSPHTPVLPSDEWKGKSGLLPYADFVMMMDDYVGKVNQALKEAGLDQNTLLIFSSDNGCSPAAGFEKMVELGHFPSAQFRGHKADIYEGGHRVPFFAKWPAVIKKGSVSNETISLIDFFATAADLSGYFVQDHEGEDSYSLLPLFRGERRQGDFREATVFHSVNGSFAIRKGDWKLILAPGSGGWSFPRPGDPETNDLPPVQLYNLATDPGEKINLEALQAEKVKELRALLSRYIREGRSIPGASQVNDPTDGEWKQVWFLEGN